MTSAAASSLAAGAVVVPARTGAAAALPVAAAEETMPDRFDRAVLLSAHNHLAAASSALIRAQFDQDAGELERATLLLGRALLETIEAAPPHPRHNKLREAVAVWLLSRTMRIVPRQA